jgi:histidinol phosphatase-like enzyme
MATVSRMHVNVTAGTASYAKSMAKNEKRTKTFSERVKKMGGGLRAVATGAVAAGAALAGMGFAGKKVFDLGAEIEETGSKFNTVFGPQGSAQMNEFLDGFANKAGLTTNEAKGLVATTGAIAQGMGFGQVESAKMASEITKLSGDLSSFNNLPTEEVLMAVNSALTGEREQMKRLGIVIKETDVQQMAMAQSGKTVASTLTQQEKATATLALITQKAGVAVGDLDRTQNSSANVARRLIAMFKELRDVLAKILMPVFGEVLTNLTGQSGKFEEIKNKLMVNANVIQAWGRVAISAFATVGKMIMGPVRAIGNMIQAMGNLIVATKAFIARDAELRKQAMEDFEKNFNEGMEQLVSPVQAMIDFTGVLFDAIEESGKRGKGFARAIETVGNTVNAVTTPAMKKLTDEVKTLNEQFNETISKFGEDFASGVANNVVSSVSTMSNAFTGFFQKMQKQLVEATLQWLLFKALTGMFPNSEFVANLTGTQTGGQIASKGAETALRTGKRGVQRLAPPTPAPVSINQNVNFSVNAIDSRDAARFIQDNQGEIAKVVVDASKKSFGVRKAFTTGSP